MISVSATKQHHEVFKGPLSCSRTLQLCICLLTRMLETGSCVWRGGVSPPQSCTAGADDSHRLWSFPDQLCFAAVPAGGCCTDFLLCKVKQERNGCTKSIETNRYTNTHTQKNWIWKFPCNWSTSITWRSGGRTQEHQTLRLCAIGWCQAFYLQMQHEKELVQIL